MTAKKSEIENEDFNEVINSPEKIIYPVEVELSENFLEKNPTLKGIYENGTMKIGLLPNIGSEFSDEITKLIPELKSDEIVLFNPLIETINTLASYDYIVGTTKPERPEGMDDKEYEKTLRTWIKSEETRYKSVSKLIRDFNGTTSRTKDEIKAPILERGRKIDALYKTLKAFSDQRREILTRNFQPYMQEMEELKKAKADAVNAKHNEKVKELEQQTEETNKKLANAEKKNKYADMILEISTYFSQHQESIPILNIGGLLSLKKEVEEKDFQLSTLSDIGPLEQITLENMIKTSREGTMAVIDSAILAQQAGSDKAEEKEFVDNQLPGAQIAETLYGSGHSNPSKVTQYGYVPTFNTEVTNDEENFAIIIANFNMIVGCLQDMKGFEEPKMAKQNEVFIEQKGKVLESVKKLSTWIQGLEKKYKEFILNQK